MFRLAVKSVRYQWRRFALTTLAVVLGVSSVTAAFVLSDSLARSIDAIVSEAAAPVDLVVRPSDGDGFGAPTAGLPASLVDEVAGVPGVRSAHGSIQGAGQFVSDGEVSGQDFAGAGAVPSDPELFGLSVTGRVPRSAGEAVIDAASAKRRGLGVGDSFQFATPSGVLNLQVVGQIRFGTAEGLGALAYVGLSDEEAATAVGTPGRVNEISVALDPGADQAQVAEAISTMAGAADAEVATRDELLAEAREIVGTAVTVLTGVLLGFAGITLFVAAFLIFNTFTIVVAQRSRELALLRAIGASGRQVTRSVVAEALLVGVVASVLGLALGVLAGAGMRALLGVVAEQLPDAGLVLATRTVVVAALVGVGVTLAAVAAPARRAAKIPPVAAMSAAASPPQPRRGATWSLVGLLGAAVVAFAAALTAAEGAARVAVLAASAVAVFLAVTGLARHLTDPVIRVLSAAPRRMSLIYALAARNAARAPRRTASTAAAMMVGLALVVGSLVLGSSFKAAAGGELRTTVKADLILEPQGIIGVTPALVDALERQPEVASVVALPTAAAQLGDETLTVTAVDPSALANVFDVQLTAGTLPADGEVAVSEAWAQERGVEVGSSVAGEQGGEWVVSGLFAADDVVAEAIVTPRTAEGLPGVDAPAQLAFVTANGSPAAAERAVVAALEASPGLEVFTLDEFVTSYERRFDVALSVVNVLLLMSVVVAALGVTNTMALSVLERTRELGVLRAIGMRRRSVRRMVRAEGVYVAAYGGVLGVTLGLLFGTAAVWALPSGTAELSIPFAGVAAVFVAAAALGVAASALPARRAARLNVLAAITDP
jgi:putative ABC transport system permease protein